MILEILTLSRPQKTLKQRDALFKKHCRGKKAKDVAGQPFTNADGITHITRGSPQPTI